MLNYPNYPFFIDKPDNYSHVLGCFVVSNAPINVEKKRTQQISPQQTYESIQEIAKFFQDSQDNTEVVINIHGYNTKESDAKELYQKILGRISSDNYISGKKLVFIGYRWPSEHFLGKGDNESESFKQIFQDAIQGLPILYKSILIVSLISILLFALRVISLLFLFTSIPKIFIFIISLLLSLSFFGLGFVFSAIFIRVTVYLRDAYRATNYGVPDLVELIRQLDYAIVNNSPGNNRGEKKEDWKHKKIKLSFMGHSMGTFVTTNVIRILSDIFDENSIEQPSENQKQPSPNIGNVFSLGRLVLAAPDIPIETILPDRANFLRSSLRRFEESYVFSNEGDIVLRFASTATNYLSFPAITHDRGFRLGNVIVGTRQEVNSVPEPKGYGIINLKEGYTDYFNAYGVMSHIFIASDGMQKSLEEVADYKKDPEKKPIAALFTYFDCTDYKEKGEGVVSRALNKPILNYWDYIVLIFDYLLQKRDVHYAYFYGEFSQTMLYGLVFLGFKDFLKSLKHQLDDNQFDQCMTNTLESEKIQEFLTNQGVENDEEKEEMIRLYSAFSKICADRGIGVLLSPERYQVDFLAKEREQAGQRVWDRTTY